MRNEVIDPEVNMPTVLLLYISSWENESDIKPLACSRQAIPVWSTLMQHKCQIVKLNICYYNGDIRDKQSKKRLCHLHILLTELPCFLAFID